ncbi:Ethylene-responsive transcription factor [Actinidia chinensis var. chinensis]|uniref:Ethylene-responsive transcription factor n=1 Tax=Actinidia chinensis var. chinensis TaxID=1590841 RepID=A0A2R6Q6J8_ACTCC|nr:Ethylene-responsive transcription factor [Actinidia chinensis var. chinensis]
MGWSGDDAPKIPKSKLLVPASLAQRVLSQTLTSTANLANLPPTGTLLAFQLLTPTFTNNGSCDSATRPMTLILLALLAVSCFLASFIDSFKSSDGRVYYGFATPKGMWLFDYHADADVGPVPDFSKYRLSFIDGVHAVLSVFVFAAVDLRDKNVLSCFHPMPAHETQEVLDIVPMGIGLQVPNQSLSTNRVSGLGSRTPIGPSCAGERLIQNTNREVNLSNNPFRFKPTSLIVMIR